MKIQPSVLMRRMYSRPGAAVKAVPRAPQPRVRVGAIEAREQTVGTHPSGHLIAGAGGALLIVSLFLPWAEAGDVSASGWELWTMADVYFLIAGLIAVAAAATGGRIGLFRPDVSLIGAADILGVIATVMLVWLLIFDFPDGAGRAIGAFLALIGAAIQAGGAGDYRVLRGAPAFPKLR